VIIGYVDWAAGSFDTSYVPSLTPTESGGVSTDEPLVAMGLERLERPVRSRVRRAEKG